MGKEKHENSVIVYALESILKNRELAQDQGIIKNDMGSENLYDQYFDRRKIEFY